MRLGLRANTGLIKSTAHRRFWRAEYILERRRAEIRSNSLNLEELPSVLSDRSSSAPRDDITADERGAMVRDGLTAGPALVLGPDTDSGRGRSSARSEHHRGRAGRGRPLI